MTLAAGEEEVGAALAEAALQLPDEAQGLRREDLACAAFYGGADVNAGDSDCSHDARLVAIVVALAEVRAVALRELGARLVERGPRHLLERGRSLGLSHWGRRRHRSL
jgi:hypothetical protein